VGIRVLIADDQARSRRSLKALLTALCWHLPGPAEESTPAGCLPLEIVGEAENGAQAIAQAQVLHPDVVVMDLRLNTVSDPGARLDGMATLRTIKSRWPAIRIVVLTMYTTDRAALLAAGADAFLLKGGPTSELLDAVMPWLAGLSGGGRSDHAQ
jgi:DNA-binding NarL/FixJ family response regulator